MSQDAPSSVQPSQQLPMRWFWAVALVVLLLDQLTKWWAMSALTGIFAAPGGAELGFGDRLLRFLTVQHPPALRRLPVIDGLWEHAYHENPGAAWSMLRDAPEDIRLPFFIFTTTAALLFAVWYARRAPDRWTRLALGLVVGGALGNFFDRVRLGYVVDFVRWHWFDRIAWPVFNIADVGVTLGVGLMLFTMFQADRAAKRAGAPAAPSNSGGDGAARSSAVDPGAPSTVGAGSPE